MKHDKISRRWGHILVAGGKGLSKSLLLSAMVMGPGLLIMQKQQILGWLWMLLGSFAMMAWSYRKEWRINWVSCLIPPLMAAASYIVQLVVYGGNPNLIWLGLAAIVGLAVGIARGGTHEVYIQRGGIYARKVTGYLLVWLVCYLITQFFSMLGQKEALQIGRISGAFSTAMLIAVSVVLLSKYQKQKNELLFARSHTSIFGLFLLPLVSVSIYGWILISGNALAQPANEPYFDTPIPSGEFAFKLTPVGGCNVRVETLSRRTNQHGLRDKKIHNRTVNKLCRAQPNHFLCGNCQPDSGSGRVFIPPNVIPTPPIKVVPEAAQKAAEAALVASILILIGATAVNVANAVSEAIRQATEAAGEAMSQTDGLATETDWSATGEARVVPDYGEVDSNIPPPSRPPDITNPYDETPFEIDENGNYWAPDENGEWEWMSASEAMEAAAVMQSEVDQRERQREDFERESRERADELRERTRREDEAERQRIAERREQEISEEAIVDQSGEPAEPPPAEEPSFLGRMWDRLSSDVAGIGNEINSSVQDVWRDPWILVDTAQSINKEIDQTRNDIVEGGARAVVAAAEAVASEPRVYVETIAGMAADIFGGGQGAAGEVLREGAANIGSDMAQAAQDIYENPELIGDTLLGMDEDISAAGAAVQRAVTDPDRVYDGIKTVTGVENFENSLDPNRSLTSRVGQVGLGVMGVYGTITGAQGVAQGMRNGASTIVGRVTGSGGSLIDDTIRIGAQSADETVAVIAGAGDEVSAAGTGIAGAGDETAAAVAGASDETAAAVAGASDETAAAVAGASDETAAAVAGASDETAAAVAGASDETAAAAGASDETAAVAGSTDEAGDAAQAAGRGDDADILAKNGGEPPGMGPDDVTDPNINLPRQRQPGDPELVAQRQEKVRDMLREKGVRDDLVDRMDYQHDAPDGHWGTTQGGGRTEARGSLHREAFEEATDDGVAMRSETSKRSTALHELDHVQQRDQLRTQAAPGGPKEGYYDPRTGKLTQESNDIMEIEVRMRELDRNLAIRQDAIKRAGAEPYIRSTWPQEAIDADKEVEMAREYLKSKGLSGQKPPTPDPPMLGMGPDDITDPNIDLGGLKQSGGPQINAPQGGMPSPIIDMDVNAEADEILRSLGMDPKNRI